VFRLSTGGGPNAMMYGEAMTIIHITVPRGFFVGPCFTTSLRYCDHRILRFQTSVVPALRIRIVGTGTVAPLCVLIASWLNQVEIWFNLITRRPSGAALSEVLRNSLQKIDNYVKQYNKHPHPFAWTATVDSILAKVERLCKYIPETRH
jgi:hypothetical protein